MVRPTLKPKSPLAKTLVIGAAAIASLLSSAAFAAPAATQPTSAQLAKLEQQLEVLQSQVKVLKTKSDSTWLDKQRAAQVKAIVHSVLHDAAGRDQHLDTNLQAGYDNGFFIRTADKDFSLIANGYLQFRYTFANDRVENASIYGKSPPKSGDVNGFGFRRARLIFSGNAFTPNLTYSISGDFGGSASNSGNFQILDTYMAYKFVTPLQVRLGSFLIPFTHVEYISSGLEFPDFAIDEVPFDPVRGLGASVFGDIVPNKITYEVNINDGSNSNTLGRASDTGGALDNRMGYYARVQWAGAGKVSDFNDEPDLQNHKNLVWMIGGAVGYEEQNSTASAFPATQHSLSFFGLANPTGPGYNTTSYAVNGNMYRATVDAHAKYRGLAVNAAAYFQEYNDASQSGSATDAFRTAYGKGSLYEYGYDASVGYFIVPHHWEVVGRFGQLRTQSRGPVATQYEAGVNYYMFGENAKVQAAVSYLPSGAPYTSSAIDSAINTQDIIGQVQFQLKF